MQESKKAGAALARRELTGACAPVSGARLQARAGGLCQGRQLRGGHAARAQQPRVQISLQRRSMRKAWLPAWWCHCVVHGR